MAVVEYFVFFFQAEDGIRDVAVTGVQTCALPISRSKTVCMNLFGSWTFQTMNPEATTAFLPSVRNSRGGGTRTNRRRSNRLTVWTGAGSLNLSPGVLSTRTGLPNWVTTAYSPASTVKTHSDASPTRTAPRPRRATSLTPRVRPRAASIPPRSEGDESERYYRSPSGIVTFTPGWNAGRSRSHARRQAR